jgi:hypothetical protein
MEKSALHPIQAISKLATPKRGLKHGLFSNSRRVILMLDETIVTETPPLYNAYGRVGEQTQVPITGNRSKRVLHGALNIYSGSVALMISEKWDRDSHMAFLRIIRKQWRGWEILLFEDQGSPHTVDFHAFSSL